MGVWLSKGTGYTPFIFSMLHYVNMCPSTVNIFSTALIHCILRVASLFHKFYKSYTIILHTSLWINWTTLNDAFSMFLLVFFKNNIILIHRLWEVFIVTFMISITFIKACFFCGFRIIFISITMYWVCCHLFHL